MFEDKPNSPLAAVGQKASLVPRYGSSRASCGGAARSTPQNQTSEQLVAQVLL